jgi:hypothetical protein
LSDGQRATSEEFSDSYHELVAIGGSFTEGWAISDNETFLWKLQERFPSLKVSNYGTSGFGTYQSLLVLEETFEKSPSVSIVIYGFIEYHERRNVATAGRLKAIAKYSAGKRSSPYCTIDSNGDLIRHPPERYPAWPLREYSATINLLQKWYMKLKTKKRSSQQRHVTEKLLLRMRDICVKKRAKFLVVFLYLNEEMKAHYKAFLSENNVDFLDCAFPLTSEFRVPIEGHPNGMMNTRWVDCIEEKIRNIVKTYLL